MNFVRAINEIHTNIWAFLIIVSGVVLYCCHKADVGAGLVTGGFALMRGSAPSQQAAPVVQTQTVMPNFGTAK